MNKVDYQKLFHEKKDFERNTFVERMEEYGFKNMARMELFLWDLELFLQIQKIPCNMINCFCKYSDYEPLTLDEWIALEKNTAKP